MNKSVFFGAVLDVGRGAAAEPKLGGGVVLDTKLLGRFVPTAVRSNKSTTKRVSVKRNEVQGRNVRKSDAAKGVWMAATGGQEEGSQQDRVGK